MKKHFLASAVFCVVLFALPGQAATIHFAVPADQIGFSLPPDHFDLYTSDLNGTTLSGQSISIDALLSNNVLARASLLTPGQFGILLQFFTTGTSNPGFPGPATAFVLGGDGGRISATKIAGGAVGNNGTFVMGLSGFSYEDFGGAHFVDIGGIHMDLLMPASGETITQVSMRFTINDQNRLSLGTTQQLPEPSSLILLPLGLIGILTARKFRKKTGWN